MSHRRAATAEQAGAACRRVRRASSAKLGTETLLDDTDALDRHNDEARHQAIRWRGLWHSAGVDLSGGRRGSTSWPTSSGSSQVRVQLDADRILTVLEQPRRCFAGRPEVVNDPGTPLTGPEPRHRGSVAPTASCPSWQRSTQPGRTNSAGIP